MRTESPGRDALNLMTAYHLGFFLHPLGHHFWDEVRQLQDGLIDSGLQSLNILVGECLKRGFKNPKQS